MKLPKKVYLAAATLLFVGGAATAVILTQNNPKDVTVKQTATVNHPKVDTEATDTPESAPAKQVATTPAQNTDTQPVTTTTDPQQALKDEVAQKVRAKAAKDGVANVELQVYCVDKKLTDSGGYTSENIQSLDSGYFNLATPQYPNAYAYFDSGCKMIFENVGSA